MNIEPAFKLDTQFIPISPPGVGMPTTPAVLAEPFLAFPLRAIRSVIPCCQYVASLQGRRLDEGAVPLVEGIADQPFPWRPHLDDGDSCQL